MHDNFAIGPWALITAAILLGMLLERGLRLSKVMTLPTPAAMFLFRLPVASTYREVNLMRKRRTMAKFQFHLQTDSLERFLTCTFFLLKMEDGRLRYFKVGSY